MFCNHEIKCCHYCPCHYENCKRCKKQSLLHFEQVSPELRSKCWKCPKCASYVPFSLEDINDYRIIKRI